MRVEKTLVSIHDEKPNKFNVIDLGGGMFELILNENIQKTTTTEEDGQTSTVYQCERTAAFGRFLNKNELKGGLVRVKYSVNEEYSLINKGIENKEDVKYLEYRTYVNECKLFVNGLK